MIGDANSSVGAVRSSSSGSLYFDGYINDRVDGVAGSPMRSGVIVPLVSNKTNEFSMGVWAKFTTTVKLTQVLMSNGVHDTSSQYDGYAIQAFDGKLQINFNGVAMIDTGVNTPLNRWCHVMLVREAGVAKLYLDGTEVFSYAGSVPSVPTGFTTIGGTAGPPPNETQFFRTFAGWMYGACFYSRALTAIEITSLYQGIFIAAGCELFLPLDAPGAHQRDTSGKNRLGVASGYIYSTDAPFARYNKPRVVRPTATRVPVADSNLGRSLVLNGTQGLSQYAVIPRLKLGDTCSVSLWFRIGGIPLVAAQQIISYRSATPGSFGGFNLYINGTGTVDGFKLGFGGYNASNTNVALMLPATVFDYEVWHNTTITIQPGKVDLYVDGVLLQSSTGTIVMPSGQYLTIGRTSFTNTGAFCGYIDQLTIHDGVAWSAATVAGVFTGGTASVPEGVTAMYLFDETKGIAAIDATDNGYTAMIVSDNLAQNRTSYSLSDAALAAPHQPTYGRRSIYEM